MILTIGSLGTPQKSDSPMPSVRPATCLQVIEANFRICIFFDVWWIFGRFAQIEVVGTLPNSPLSSWNELRILWSSYFLILLLLLGRSSRPCVGSFKDVFEAAQVGPLHCRGLCFATAGSWSCWTHEHELRASCLQAWKLLCPASKGLWTPQVSTPMEIAHNKLPISDPKGKKLSSSFFDFGLCCPQPVWLSEGSRVKTFGSPFF